MATIRKRGDRYHVQVRRKGIDPVSRSFGLLGDAKEWARDLERQADRHELPDNRKSLDKTTLETLVRRYRDEVVIGKKGGDIEQVVLNAFLRHPIVKKPLSALKPSDFAKYRDERLKTVSSATLKRQLTPLKHMFRVARQEWLIPLRESPLENLFLNAVDKRRERRFRPGEFEALEKALRKTRNPLLGLIFEFALETAMRRGEILALRWYDADTERRSAIILEAKNGYSRTIPLSQKAVSLLEAAKAKQTNPGAKDRVFPVSANSIRMAWERLCKRAEIDDLHFHDLRHEAISRLFEKGLSVPEVASVSGHRDMRMLFRYAHANTQRIIEKLDILE